MEVDYELYAQGEALLGWLNATVQISAQAPFDGNALLRALADGIQSRLKEAQAEVAHLKMTLDPDKGIGGLAVINLVRNDWVPELSQALEDPLQRGQIIVNVRAEALPEALRRAVEDSLAACVKEHNGLAGEIQHLECFQPGKPEPTHRVAGLS